MESQSSRDASQDLRDQSNLLRRRAKRTVARSSQLVAQSAALVGTHHWLQIVLGRVCGLCDTAQAADEFDESVPCKARAS